MCQQLDTDIGIVVLVYSVVGVEVVVWATYEVQMAGCSRYKVRVDTPLAVEVVAVDIVEQALWLK